MRYDLPTRVLHMLLAAGIVIQLGSSLVMVFPKPGRPENAWFELHETVGFAALAVLALHWLWSLGRGYAGDVGMLFPWFRRRAIAAVWQDALDMVGELIRLRMPKADHPRPLAGAVEGLGLLLATAMAATGAIWSVGGGEEGDAGTWLHDLREIHGAGGTLMWIYLVGHASLALLHQLAGDRVLSRMFSFGRRRAE